MKWVKIQIADLLSDGPLKAPKCILAWEDFFDLVNLMRCLIETTAFEKKIEL